MGRTTQHNGPNPSFSSCAPARNPRMEPAAGKFGALPHTTRLLRWKRRESQLAINRRPKRLRMCLRRFEHVMWSLAWTLEQVIITPSFHVYKAYTNIKIQIFLYLTNNLTINFLFLECKFYIVGFVIEHALLWL